MMKTMCPPGYHHSGFMAADAVGLMIYVIYIELAKSIIYIYIYIYIQLYLSRQYAAFLIWSTDFSLPQFKLPHLH